MKYTITVTARQILAKLKELTEKELDEAALIQFQENGRTFNAHIAEVEDDNGVLVLRFYMDQL
jgi:delta 1-pyrroline-5-carboxylate dehydrogenase